MNEYENFIRRADLIKNLVNRKKLAEQTKIPNRKIQEANRQRWLQYQEIQRMLLTAKIAAANGVGGGIQLDVDAQAFITNANITNATQQTAIDTLVTGLKTDGLWTKMKAIYPFVGGTASTHKFNLKDPRDLDAAFRLVFNGGWVHSGTGALPNGTNAYADTFLKASVQLSTNSSHLSFYSRTEASSGGIAIGNTFGGTVNNQINLVLKLNNEAYFRLNSNATFAISNLSSLGLHISNRVSSIETRNFIRNVIKIQTQASTSLNANNILIAASLLEGVNLFAYDSTQCAFSTIGDGLTDTDAANLYTRVQAFQTTLSRQV